MTEQLPWNCNIGGHGLTVIYGKDFALSLSISRMIESTFYHEEQLKEDVSILYSNFLFENNLPVRVIASNKFMQSLTGKYKSRKFYRNCIIVTESSTIASKDKEVLYVKCDPLNARSRKWFTEFHMKRLGVSQIKHPESINNLDQLKFAIILQDLGYNHTAEEKKTYDIWSTIRLKQIQSQGTAGNIFKHLELWARENVPHDECLKMVYYMVSKEMEKFKNEVNKRNS